MKTSVSRLERIYILILLITKKFEAFESRNRPPFNNLRYMLVSSNLITKDCILSSVGHGFCEETSFLVIESILEQKNSDQDSNEENLCFRLESSLFQFFIRCCLWEFSICCQFSCILVIITLFKFYLHVGRGGQRIWCPSSATAVLDLGKAAKPYLSSQPSPITS